MKILVISPHTDDAELGTGGTINKFINQGDDLYWIVLSIAEESVIGNRPRNIHKTEFLNMIKLINFSKDQYNIFNFKVRNFDLSRQNILDIFVEINNNFKPDLVIGPSIHDYHQDHQITANEMIRAFKKDSSIISYELPWNHIQFNTQFFCKLNPNDIDMKIEMLSNYVSQSSRNYFDAEYIRGLARVRGTQCNSMYAESFEVLRWVI